nr:hypothetical protein [Mycobacteroides abscessus]
MDATLFSGLCETGWDYAPWESAPEFSPDELAILLDLSIPAIEAADLVGCVERDVQHLRRKQIIGLQADR